MWLWFFTCAVRGAVSNATEAKPPSATPLMTSLMADGLGGTTVLHKLLGPEDREALALTDTRDEFPV